MWSIRSPGCEELLLAPEERERIDRQVKEKITNPGGIPAGYQVIGSQVKWNHAVIVQGRIQAKYTTIKSYMFQSLIKTTLHYVYLPQQPVLGPYFLKEVSAFLSPKHCPPFCNANISRFFSRDTSAHFMSAFTRDL